MSEENAKQVENGDSVQDTSAETKNTAEHMIPKSRFDEINQKLNDATKRAEALEKAAQDAETKRLKESDDFKALYEKSEAELSSLRPQAEKLGVYEKTLQETLDESILAIPEDKRSLIPEELTVDQKLKWINRNRAHLSKAQPMNVGAGVRGGGESSTTADLTHEEMQMARAFGVSPEEYAKNK